LGKIAQRHTFVLVPQGKVAGSAIVVEMVRDKTSKVPGCRSS
jgi:hypothetical protein